MGITKTEFDEVSENTLRREEKESIETGRSAYWIRLIGLIIIGLILSIVHIIKWLSGNTHFLLSRSDTLLLLGMLLVLSGVNYVFMVFEQASRIRDLRLIRIEMKLDALTKRQDE